MKASILIGTCDKRLALWAERGLARHGFGVVCVETGLATLNQARRSLPEIILVEEFLPDLGGLWVCGLLQAQPSTRQPQIGLLVGQRTRSGLKFSTCDNRPLLLEKPRCYGGLVNQVRTLAKGADATDLTLRIDIGREFLGQPG